MGPSPSATAKPPDIPQPPVRWRHLKRLSGALAAYQNFPAGSRLTGIFDQHAVLQFPGCADGFFPYELRSGERRTWIRRSLKKLKRGLVAATACSVARTVYLDPSAGMSPPRIHPNPFPLPALLAGPPPPRTTLVIARCRSAPPSNPHTHTSPQLAKRLPVSAQHEGRTGSQPAEIVVKA